MEPCAEGKPCLLYTSFQFWRCVPEHVFRADGAFGQYGVVFEDKDTVLILQSSSSNQQEQLTCAWEALLPAITEDVYKRQVARPVSALT